MSENLTKLETAVQSLLAQDPHPTPESIRNLITQFRLLDSLKVDDETAELLAKKFEVQHGVTMTIGAILTDQKFEPWLEGARAAITPYYWGRYKKLLAELKFSGPVIQTMDSVTDRILGLLENPQKGGQWDRRGMVMGHVQSGKTANYTGLICKAADAGYRLIVVIAGIHNNLRNQTQVRIDEGFVGRDSARLLSKKGYLFVGVGRYDQTRRPITFTNSSRDFSKAMATSVGVPLQNLNEPAVFVIKKNGNTLGNLVEWLREHSAKGGSHTVDAPMLLIDDEADNASINIRHDKHEVSVINGWIRNLLRLFERSCYVGYTATPFANIFIDPDTDDHMRGADLFPKNFIVSLDPPTNYFGPQKVFVDEPKQFVRYVEDSDGLLPLWHKKGHEVGELPESLVSAVRAFVVARAIRLVRGHAIEHNSMLVNASRFTDVQRQLRNEIHRIVEGIQASVRVNGALAPAAALADPEIAALRSVWEREYAGTGVDWPAIQERLNDSAAAIRVVEVNSRSSGALNYGDYKKSGLSVISVGGFSLSRGLTLEGLLISYFLRNSMMYDTLMQMGRWFGYRPGYEDLCRIWMPEEAEGWYAHITESIEMLREELRSMQAANATPEDFGLKVRSHPDTLMVTARNKMGSGERVAVSIGLGNSFVETATLRADEPSLRANREAVRRLAERFAGAGRPLQKAETVAYGRLLRGAPVGPVLAFLGEFQNHVGSMLTDPGPVRRYIEDRDGDELAIWDVLFAGVGRAEETTIVDTSLGIPINCQRRTAGKRSDANTLRVSNKHRVASRGVEKTGLSGEEIATAERNYRTDAQAGGKAVPPDGKAPNYPDRAYRRVRKTPLLIIHLLKIDDAPVAGLNREPVVAWSISFPVTALEEKRVEYVVNTTWLRENFASEIDEEEIGGDAD